MQPVQKSSSGFFRLEGCISPAQCLLIRVVAQLALRLLIPVALVFAGATLVPIAFQATFVTGAGIGATFLSGFLFQGEMFARSAFEISSPPDPEQERDAERELILEKISRLSAGDLGEELFARLEAIEGPPPQLQHHSAPPVPGQPIGFRNSGTDCWLNAGLQVVRSLPELMGEIERSPMPEMARILHILNQSQEVRTHLLRPILSQLGRPNPNQPVSEANPLMTDICQGGQQDAATGLRVIFNACSPMELRITTRYEVKGQVPLQSGTSGQITTVGDARTSTEIVSGLMELPCCPNRNLQTVLDDYLYEQVTDLDPVLLTGVDGKAYPYYRKSVTLSYQKLPPHLCIQLKRFTVQREDPPLLARCFNIPVDPTFRARKDQRKVTISHKLTFPESENAPQTSYEIRAIIVHEGDRTDRGHYVAYVKRVIEGKEMWFYCNDSCVTKIEVDEVPFGDAYILAYGRVDHGNDRPS